MAVPLIRIAYLTEETEAATVHRFSPHRPAEGHVLMAISPGQTSFCLVADNLALGQSEMTRAARVYEVLIKDPTGSTSCSGGFFTPAPGGGATASGWLPTADWLAEGEVIITELSGSFDGRMPAPAVLRGRLQPAALHAAQEQVSPAAPEAADLQAACESSALLDFATPTDAAAMFDGAAETPPLFGYTAAPAEPTSAFDPAPDHEPPFATHPAPDQQFPFAADPAPDLEPPFAADPAPDLEPALATEAFFDQQAIFAPDSSLPESAAGIDSPISPDAPQPQAAPWAGAITQPVDPDAAPLHSGLFGLDAPSLDPFPTVRLQWEALTGRNTPTAPPPTGAMHGLSGPFIAGAQPDAPAAIPGVHPGPSAADAATQPDLPSPGSQPDTPITASAAAQPPHPTPTAAGAADPAVPPIRIPVPNTIVLQPCDPRASRARGSAVLDHASGSLLLTVKGLGAPGALLGGQRLTQYRAWLYSERTGLSLGLGTCQRISADTYRLESAGRLKLSQFEHVQVSAEPEAAQPGRTGPNGPILLTAAYHSPVA